MEGEVGERKGEGRERGEREGKGGEEGDDATEKERGGSKKKWREYT